MTSQTRQTLRQHEMGILKWMEDLDGRARTGTLTMTEGADLAAL